MWRHATHDPVECTAVAPRPHSRSARDGRARARDAPHSRGPRQRADVVRGSVRRGRAIARSVQARQQRPKHWYSGPQADAEYVPSLLSEG